MRKRLRLLKNEFVSNYDGFFRFLLAFGIFPLVLIGLLGERGVGKDIYKETLEIINLLYSYTLDNMISFMNSITPNKDYWIVFNHIFAFALFIFVTFYTTKFILIVIHDYIGTKFHKKEVCWHEEFDY